jgi:hypothetical protein
MSPPRRAPQLDEASLSKFHLRAVLVSGMGFFTDAYKLMIAVGNPHEDQPTVAVRHRCDALGDPRSRLPLEVGCERFRSGCGAQGRDPVDRDVGLRAGEQRMPRRN